jgi:menaquinone-dependent protoporphyrinogen oxidase
MTALLLYSSRDGQTRRIMQKMAELLSEHMVCEVADLHQLATTPDWDRYQRVMLGASIRYGRFHPQLWRFVQQQARPLNQRLSAFFCVNLVARKSEKRTVISNPYLRKFLQRSPWQPMLCCAFAGELCYPRYRWFDRLLIQFIMLFTQGETDTSTVIEYTDWQQVASFAQQFFHLSES